MALELYGSKSCPYTAELREDLEYKGLDFVEYDIEADPVAARRLADVQATPSATPLPTAVPILVEDGRVVQVGMNGRSRYVTPG